MTNMSAVEGVSYPLVLDKVRRCVVLNSIRILEFLRPYDRLNHGRISPSQFHRALSAAGVQLSEAEADCLAEAHQCYKTGNVDYREFCEEVNKVFTTYELEKHPQTMPLKPGEVLLPLPQVQLQPSEMEEAQAALRRLRILNRTRRLDLRASFAQFDRHNTGKLSPSLFERGFPIAFRENKFTEDEVRLLGKLVTTPDGFVDCRKLGQLVEDSVETPEEQGVDQTKCGGSTPIQPVNSEEGAFSQEQNDHIAPAASTRTWARNHRSPVDKIETAVAARQLAMRESFRVFDGLRRGACTQSQAEAILLSVLLIQLDENDLKTLFQQFSTSDGMFKYDALCQEVEHRLGNPDAERFPTRIVPKATPSELRKLQEDKPSMTAEEKEKLKAIQERLAFRVKQTRKMLLPTFQDFDKRRTQHVTRWQLWRIFGMVDLPINEEELDLLCLWLCDRGNLNEVAYRPLLVALDPPAAEASSSSSSAGKIKESNYFQNGKVVPLSETLRMRLRQTRC